MTPFVGINHQVTTEVSKSKSGGDNYLKLEPGKPLWIYPVPDADGNILVSERVHKIVPKSGLQKGEYARNSNCWGDEDCPLCQLQKEGYKNFEKLQVRCAMLVYVPEDTGNKIKLLNLYVKFMEQFKEIYKTRLEELVQEVTEENEEVGEKVLQFLNKTQWNIEPENFKTIEKFLKKNKLQNFAELFKNPFKNGKIKISKLGKTINELQYVFVFSEKANKKEVEDMNRIIDENPEKIISLSDVYWKRDTIKEIEDKYGDVLPIKVDKGDFDEYDASDLDDDTDSSIDDDDDIEDNFI